MPKWNRFSDEVAEERRTVRAYKLDKVMDRVKEPDTFKGQALRQLAMRLELEDQLKDRDDTIAGLVNQIEKLEAELEELKKEATAGWDHTVLKKLW